ncbi:MAG: glycosyltransferase family 4 protein, partial [Gemmatimonadetes bacterium]|nr:glycosyltransferase family 4 protein [Gemmatimonadota bacterium]
MASRPLRIGIDGTCLALRRGYGRFLRELMPPLLELDRTNEYVLFVDRHAVRDIPELPVRIVEPATRHNQVDAPSARGNRALGDVFTMGKSVAAEKLDLMYFPSVFSWFPVRGVKTAVAFHDTIAERYAKVVFPTFKTRMLWKLKVGLARRQATGIVTVSEWSKRSLASWFKIPEERIFVTPEAPSPEFGPVLSDAPRRAWLKEAGLPEDARYFIYVGGFNPHKNLREMLHAFADVTGEGDAGKPVHFILVGDYQGDTFHSEVSVLQGIIKERGMEDRVHFVGFVPDEDLRNLYAGSIALAIPSLEEGFGLPAVEAAA